MTPQQLLVHRLIHEALNGKDYSVLPDLLHEEYVYRTPGEELLGAESLQGLFMMYHAALPDLSVRIDDMFGDGDRVATAFTLSGTHEGEMMGMPPTGRPVSVHGIIHSRVRDGRIVEEWELVDLAALVEQLDGEPED
jgi:steroid delta-isomerase-like uncharacterized protein